VEDGAQLPQGHPFAEILEQDVTEEGEWLDLGAVLAGNRAVPQDPDDFDAMGWMIAVMQEDDEDDQQEVGEVEDWAEAEDWIDEENDMEND
jgi:hypothetical protein